MNQTDKCVLLKDKMKKLAGVIAELEAKCIAYKRQYGLTRDDSVYQKYYYAREGLKMAKKEFGKLQNQHFKLTHKGGEQNDSITA